MAPSMEMGSLCQKKFIIKYKKLQEGAGELNKLLPGVQ